MCQCVCWCVCVLVCVLLRVQGSGLSTRVCVCVSLSLSVPFFERFHLPSSRPFDIHALLFVIKIRNITKHGYGIKQSLFQVETDDHTLTHTQTHTQTHT